MRIFAVIANFGTRNDQYVRRLLEEYRAVPGADVLVLTNVAKSFGSGVEVVVRPPVGDPWTFPFAHKQILADRCDKYDLFIYSEDDTLITGKNIDAFLKSTAVLPDNEIAGFLRTEQDTDGQLYISTVHSYFHWDPASVVSRGDELFARFTNEHAAAYMLTQAQLKHAIRSGGFLVEPHREKYDYLVTAATDPYTQCGLKKVISISHIDDFLLPHLANKYVGKMGVSEALFRRQLSALRAIQRGTLPAITLLPEQSEGDGDVHSKSYYESSRSELLSLIPAKTRTLLSYGCGWGATEAALAARGIQVTAVPLDSVIGTCAEGKGVEVVYEDADSLMMSLSGRQFDVILISNILHLVPEPARLLAWLRRLLSQNGTLVAALPNLRRPTTMLRQLRRQRDSLSAKPRGASKYRPSYAEARTWFKRAGLKITTSIPCIPERAQALCRMTGHLTAPLLASEFLIAASRQPEHGSEVKNRATAARA